MFATRTSCRPNPIGVDRARVIGILADGLLVADREAVDRMPVIDIKPVLKDVGERYSDSDLPASRCGNHRRRGEGGPSMASARPETGRRR